jgi:hypothetical protein
MRMRGRIFMDGNGVGFEADNGNKDLNGLINDSETYASGISFIRPVLTASKQKPYHSSMQVSSSNKPFLDGFDVDRNYPGRVIRWTDSVQSFPRIPRAHAP